MSQTTQSASKPTRRRFLGTGATASAAAGLMVHDIVAAAEKNGVSGCVCFECRFSNQFQVTRALIDEGLLGRLHYGEVDYYHGIGPWYGQFRWNTGKKDGGSALLTAGCHALDALLMVMGSDVESVASLSTRSANTLFAPYEYDTSSVTILRFKNGAMGKTAAIVDCLQPYYFHTHLNLKTGATLGAQVSGERVGETSTAREPRLGRLTIDGRTRHHGPKPSPRGPIPVAVLPLSRVQWRHEKKHYTPLRHSVSARGTCGRRRRECRPPGVPRA